MKLTETKSSLARLMSEENLIVEQRTGTPSAFFDTENRLLVVPEFKDSLSHNVMDLMLSHECGHALFTPNEEWLDAVREQKINKTIINVICDARIERLIKNKYPGLRKIYHNAYKELFASDFFGTSKMDLTELNLIDRINLYFKVGFIESISFSDVEKEFVSATEKTQTFQDVIALSKEIQEFLKEKLQEDYEKLKEEENFFEYHLNGELKTDESNNSHDDEFEGFDQEKAKREALQGNDLDNNFDDSYDISISLEEFLDNELKSYTQEASEINVKELYKDEGKQSIYIDIPSNDLKEIVIDYKVIFQNLKEQIKSEAINNTNFNKFKAENSSIISYLVKEFNLKKNAKGRKKVKISKTGDLSLNKIYSYKISDDIFKRNASVSKEQSHGLVFFLDWSGSMTEYFSDTIKQLMTLLLFCKKVNISFEVYAFTTSYPYEDDYESRINELVVYPLKLMNIFSSRMSNIEFIEASNYLLSCDGQRFRKDPNATYYDYRNTDHIPIWFSLGNTPLNHSIIYSNKVMEDFKEKTKVQIVNAIYLTDGESHNINFCVEEESKFDNKKTVRFRDLHSVFYSVYIRDKKSKEVMKYDSKNAIRFGETNQCVKFIKQFCDFKMFAFRLIKPSELKAAYYKMSGNVIDNTKDFNKNNCLEVKTNFDKFYFVKVNLLNNTEEMGDIEGKTVSNIAKDFTKILSKKINTRIFMTKFIDFIS